jgi:hypothetical protein
MSADTAQRPTRADQVRTERRRKPGSTTITGMKLHVDNSLLDPAYEYRWANDRNGRVQQLYADDWDKVEDPNIVSSAGTVPTLQVGVDEGKPFNAVLLRKRKEWYQADQQEKQKPLDEIEESIRRGVGHQTAEPELRGDVAYTPGGSNTVSR